MLKKKENKVRVEKLDRELDTRLENMVMIEEDLGEGSSEGPLNKHKKRSKLYMVTSRNGPFILQSS